MKSRIENLFDDKYFKLWNKAIYFLFLIVICLVCPSGETVTIDFNNKDGVTFDVIGPSEDVVSATDALFESGEKLFLSSGDVFITKDLCPFDNALLLSISFSVKDVSSVKVILLDRLSTEIDTVIVSEIQFLLFQ